MTDHPSRFRPCFHDDFPGRTQLFRGAILCTIAEALFVAGGADSYSRSWDGIDYVLTNDEGTLGDVTFHATGVIGAFGDIHTSRWTERHETGETWRRYFTGAPPDLLAIGEETAHAIGSMVSGFAGTITAGFWSEDEKINGAEDWASIWEHGAHILRLELLPVNEAGGAIAGEYGFDTRRVAAIFTIFERTMATTKGTVELTTEEEALCYPVGGRNENRVTALLTAVGIVVRAR